MEKQAVSSPPPEENSALELTGGESQQLVQGTSRVMVNRELGKRVMSEIHEKGSLMLEVSSLWEEVEKDIVVKELALSHKVKEVKKKEELVDEKEKEIDLKLVLERNVMRLVLEKESEQVSTKLGLFRASLVKEREELDVKKEEIRLLEESVDEKARVLETREKEFCMKLVVDNEIMKREAEVMAKAREEVDAREKEVKLLDEVVSERSIALKKKEKEFALKQEVDAIDVEGRRKFLEDWEKELEKKQREFGERLVREESRKRTRRESRSKKRGRNADSRSLRQMKKRKPVEEISSGSESEDTCEEVVCLDEDDEPFDCLEPDFNEFNSSISSFKVGQVWALYDPIDAMPRYYARIKGVLKRENSLRVRWLESVENTANMKPIPIATGRFKYTDRQSETKSLAMFSHEMLHVGRSKNVTIYPKEGETWALFRDWNKTWISTHREQHKAPYQYDFVEVISEFDNENGIGVTYLGRMEGLTSVYVPANNNGVIQMMIASDEMLRFSHRVPSFKLIGDEKEGIPECSFELDTAAIPQACLNEYSLVLV